MTMTAMELYTRTLTELDTSARIGMQDVLCALRQRAFNEVNPEGGGSLQVVQDEAEAEALTRRLEKAARAFCRQSPILRPLAGGEFWAVLRRDGTVYDVGLTEARADEILEDAKVGPRHLPLDGLVVRVRPENGLPPDSGRDQAVCLLHVHDVATKLATLVSNTPTFDGHRYNGDGECSTDDTKITLLRDDWERVVHAVRALVGAADA